MAFAGCSFTWGQGLYYYSARESIRPDPPYGYNKNNHSVIDHLFREKWRWCSQVADHFGTVALTHYKNGGANDQIVEYWDACFSTTEPRAVRSFNKLDSHDLSQPIKYNDISHFVFQFTGWMRTKFLLTVNGVINGFDTFDISDRNQPEVKEAFEKFIEELDIAIPLNTNKLGAFHRSIIKKDVDSVKQFLQGLESQGIKTYVMCWPWEHSEHIVNDDWLSSRFIQFNYNGETFRCIEEMMRDAGPGLTIETDLEFFDEPPQDGHPSFKCHKIIAENVIKFIGDHNG